jgi:tRNA (guanine37-N1)-methyltransferase
MRIDILSLFPRMFEGPFSDSIIKRTLEKGLLSINITDYREYTHNKHKRVDDYPYGGGPGMIISPEPIYNALKEVKKHNKGPIYILSPQGKVFNQKMAEDFANLEAFALICGHYEGIDQRVRDYMVDGEISIGDFVLTGGELAAMIIVDAVARLIPKALGDDESSVEESFSIGRLEYPQYTRPYEFMGYKVPDVLLSGNHEEIRKWKLKESLKATLLNRPDLIKIESLTKEELKFFDEIKKQLT